MIKYLSLAVAAMSLAATANGTTDGEKAWQLDGTPARIGQPTLDHLFVRGTVDGESQDDLLSFADDNLQLMWLWLDDDQIYLNNKVQSLTPIPYNSAGDLYHEITYNSFQCDLYLPEHVKLVGVEDEEEGDIHYFKQGPRMPNSTEFSYHLNSTEKSIDGVTYKVYRLLCTSSSEYGCHFSSKSAAAYKTNGALKKDDGALMGLYLQLDDDVEKGTALSDVIIANVEFGFREAFLATPQWEPNDYRFFYGTGGNNTTQRYQYYHRVKLISAKPGDEPVTENRLTVPESLMAVSGMEFDLPVALTNMVNASALQCDIVLPEGLSLKQDGSGAYLVSVNGERMSETHTLSTRLLADGSVRVLIASPASEPFISNKGELFTLHIKVADGMQDSDCEVQIKNIVLADVAATTYNLPDVATTVSVKSYVKGDANCDDMVNVGDYVTTVKYILNQNPMPFFFMAADVDENQVINAGDLDGITEMIFDNP